MEREFTKSVSAAPTSRNTTKAVQSLCYSSPLQKLWKQLVKQWFLGNFIYLFAFSPFKIKFAPWGLRRTERSEIFGAYTFVKNMFGIFCPFFKWVLVIWGKLLVLLEKLSVRTEDILGRAKWEGPGIGVLRVKSSTRYIPTSSSLSQKSD